MGKKHLLAGLAVKHIFQSLQRSGQEFVLARTRVRLLVGSGAMDRRSWLLACASFAAACRTTQPAQVPNANQRRVAITMDDPNTEDTPRCSVEERNSLILEQLAARRVQVMLFVCGKRIDSPRGADLLSACNAAGHLLANHSYSHQNYNDPANTSAALAPDIAQCEALIANYPGFRRRFRFPMLKEGETLQKRDALRELLRERGYANGHVSIDASDWAYDKKLIKRLKANPAIDLAAFRAAYLTHMLDRAHYYDRLATTITGHSIAHTLLLHHNLLNALFLGDLLDALERDGFRIIGPEQAFADPIFALQPATIPAGESLVWSLAHEAARLRAGLRYPGEDDTYEAEALSRL
jgi:peptidoglycan/xylan/chitin deacetylase (PgdA/CDA1 family)